MKRVEVAGVGVVEFPDSMTNQQIAAVLRQRFSAQPAGTATSAGLAGAGERMLSNLMEIPQLPGRAMNVAADFLNQPLSIGGVNLGGTPPEGPGVLASDFRFGRVPLPTGRQVAAAIETPVQAVMAGQSLADAFGQRMQARTQMAEQRPGATAVGQFAGDAATLAMGRAPFVRPSGGGVFDQQIGSMLTRYVTAARGPQASALRRTSANIVNSDTFRNIARGAGRAGEAGLEGAAMSLLQNGDPLETAAFAAGGQAVSSLGGELFEDAVNFLPGKTFKGKLLSAAASAAATGGILQLLKSAMPGGEDNVIESLESGFNKAMLAIALGGALDLVGRRPSGGGILREFPAIADAMQTLPRTGIIKLAQAAASDPEIERATQNAPLLSQSDAKLYMDALESDEPAQALRELMDRNERIRRVLTARDPRLATIPVRKD